jgi:hypothetical protein
MNFDDTDVVFWIHVDDEAEPSEPAEGVTVPLLYYRYPYGPNLFEGDIGAISGSPVPEGPGPGYVVPENLTAFAVSGLPFTADFGEYDIICGFLESITNEIEIFGINCNDPSDYSNQHLCTLTDFQGAPVDIEMIPAISGGFDAGNDWIIVLEQGISNECFVEIFSHDGTKLKTSSTLLTGVPVALDVDPYNFQIHVWYSGAGVPGSEYRAAVFGIEE